MEKYLRDILHQCQEQLGDNLYGLYMHGSRVQNDNQGKRSDVDMICVVHRQPAEDENQALATALRNLDLSETGGLEMDVITKDTAAQPGPMPIVELSLATETTGPLSMRQPYLDLLISIETCRRQGLILFGPPPAEVFGSINRSDIMRAVIHNLEWHQSRILDSFHDPLGQYSVLNACRAWRFGAENVLVSKSEGAKWVLSREPGNELAQGAWAIRRGESQASLNGEAVKAFLERVIALCKSSNLAEGQGAG